MLWVTMVMMMRETEGQRDREGERDRERGHLFIYGKMFGAKADALCLPQVGWGRGQGLHP